MGKLARIQAMARTVKKNTVHNGYYRIKNLTLPQDQCCGSGMISSQIQDPTEFHSESQILLEKKKSKFL
jgi:hypothetical protein